VNGEIQSVLIETEPEFSVGTQQVVANGDYGFANWKSYDVHPDGERVLMQKFVKIDNAGPVFISLVHVTNWFEELKRLAPPDDPQ
jgi:hypothetical protein